MADINIQELASALSALAKQSTTMSNHIKTAGEIIAEAQDPLDNSAKAYEKHLKRIKGLNSEEADLQKTLLKHLKQTEIAHKKALAARTLEITQLKDQVKKAKDTQDKLKAAQDIAVKYQGVASAEARKLQGELTKVTDKLLELQHAQDEAIAAADEHEKQQKALTQALVDQEKQLRKIAINDRMGSMLDTIGTSIKGAINKYLPTQSVGDLAGTVYQGMKQEMNTGVNAYSSLSDNLRTSALGMSAQEWTTLMQENRTGVLAAGGQQDSLAVMESMFKNYKGIMSPDERAKYSVEQMTILTKAGIKPTVQSMDILRGSMASLQKSAGMTGAMFNAAVAEIVESEGIQTNLKSAASDAERQAILKATATRLSELRVMGLSIDQSKAMIKASQDMVAAGPMARFKAAIKQSMLGSMLGVSGMDRYRQLKLSSREVQNRPENQKFMQEKEIEIANKQSVIMGQEIGGNLAVEAAAGALDPNGILGENGKFNTRMAKAAEVTEAATKSLGDISDASKTLIETLNEVGNALTKNLLGQSFMSVGSSLVGLVSDIASTIASGLGSVYIGKKMFGGLGGTSTKGPGAMGKMASKGSSILSGVGSQLAKSKGGMLKGGAGVIAGMGLEYGAEALKDAGHVETGKAVSVAGNAASYAGTGAMLGSFIAPGIGTTIGAVGGGILGAGMGIYENYMADDKTPAQDQPDPSTTSLSKQITQMDESNEYLKKMTDATDKLVSISEKQLSLMTMTESERTKETTRAKFLNSNGFQSKYAML